MLTLDQLSQDPRFEALDSEGKKAAIDEFYATEGTDKQTGEASDGAVILKRAIDLGDRYEQETDLRKPFVAQEFDALTKFRDRLRSLKSNSSQRLGQRFSQGLSPESEEGKTIFKAEEENFKEASQEAINDYVAEQLQIQNGLSQAVDYDRQTRAYARRFLLNDPQRAENQRERENKGFFDAVGEVATDAIEGLTGPSDVQQSEREIAAAERQELINLISEREGLETAQATERADQIIAEEEQVQASETEGGFFVSPAGEVVIPPTDLARMTEEEAKAEVEAIDAPAPSKKRFLDNMEAYRRQAAKAQAEMLVRAVGSGQLELRSQEQIRKAAENEEARALGRDLPHAEVPTSQEMIGAADFEDPDNIQKLLRQLEDEGTVTAAMFRSAESSVAQFVGGAGSLALAPFDDQASQDFARGASSVAEGAATANELSRLGAGGQFFTDLAGVVPDLAVAYAGGAGARGVNALFGATGKTAKALTLAGVSAGSGLSSGLKTFNEARSKGFDPAKSLQFGMEAFLVTSAVTALGGIKSGAEAILTGNALFGIEKGFKEYLGTVLKGATNEAIEEMADNVISSLTYQQELNPELSINEHVKAALHAAALGAAIGGGLPAITGVGDINLSKENREVADLNRKFEKDPTSLTDQEIQRLRDRAMEQLADRTQGDKARQALAEQENRTRLERGEPVSSVEQNPSQPEGTPALPQQSEPNEKSDGQEQEEQGEQVEDERQSTRNRGEADQGLDSRASARPEVRSEVTAQDSARADALVDESFSLDPVARVFARDRVLSELQRNPEATDAELTQAAQEAAASIPPPPPVENTSTEPQGTDQEVFEQTRQALLADEDPVVKAAAKNMELVQGRSDQQAVAARLGEFFGRRVLFVRGISPNGFFTTKAPDTIFINEKTDRAQFQVVAHETLHSFQATNPEAYADLRAAVDADLEAYVQAVPVRGRRGPEFVKDEFLADFFADKMLDPKFLSKLAQDNPSTFQTFADFVRGLLQKLRAFIGQTRNLGTSRFVSDIEAAETALATALVEFRRGAGQAQTAPAKTGGKAQVNFENPSTLYRAESRQVRFPGEGAIFYTPDRSYAELYFSDDRVVKEAGYPEDLHDLRKPKDLESLKTWIEAEIIRLEESETPGIRIQLRDAKRFLDKGDVKSVSSSLANLGMALSIEKGLPVLTPGVGEKAFLDAQNLPAMVALEFFRSEGDETSIAFRSPQDIPPVKGQVNFENPVTPEMDAAHKEAVESGNLTEAQKLVDEVARLRGYDAKAFHGTPDREGFTVFRTERESLEEGNTADPNTFIGAHFAEEQEVAARFAGELYGSEGRGGRVVPVFLKLDNPLGGNAGPGFAETKARSEENQRLRNEAKKFTKQLQEIEEDISKIETDHNIEILEEQGVDAWVRDQEQQKRQKRPDLFEAKEKVEKQRDTFLSEVPSGRETVKIELPGGEAFLHGDRRLISEDNFGLENLIRESLGRDPAAEASRKVDRANRERQGRAMRKALISEGFDSVVYENQVEGGISIIVTQPNQIKSAEPATYDDQGNLIPLSERFDPDTADIRFEEPTGPDFAPDPKLHQIQGAGNIFSPKEAADLEGAKAVISSVFDSETTELTKAGEAEARAFLAALTDPAFVKDLITRVKAETINTDAQARAVVSAASESAFFNFAARYALQNRKAGVQLIYDGFRLRSEIYQEGTSGGRLEEEAYERALFLRALQAFPGGRIVGLFREENKSRLSHVVRTMGKARADLVKQVSDTDLAPEEVASLVDEAVAEALAEEQQRIARAEKQVRKAWQVVLALIKGEPVNSETRLEDPTSDPFADFERLVMSETSDLDEISAAFDALAPQLVRRVGKKRAKKVQQAATKAAMDRIGASIIRRAEKIGEVKKPTKNKVLEEFKKFLETNPSREAFITKYVDLGGSPDQAGAVYEAQQKIDADKADRAERRQRETAARREQREAEKQQEKVDNLIGRLDGTVEPTTRPFRVSVTRIVERFTKADSEQTADDLRSALNNIQNKEGKPVLTEEQTNSLMEAATEAKARNVAARDAALEEKAQAKREADARKASEKAARKVERLQKRVDDLIGKLNGSIEPVQREFRVSITRIVRDFISPSKAAQPAQDLESALVNLRDSDGQPVLTPAQINELVSTAVQTRKQADKAREAKQEAKDAAAQVARAERMFDPVKKRQPAETRSVTKIIMDEYIKNPKRKIISRDDRIEFAKEILSERTDLPAEKIQEVAEKIEGKLGDKLFEKKKVVAERVLKALGRGTGLTQAQLDNAVRLEIFDPRNDFVTSVAALNNWEGLSDSQSAALLESQRRVDLAQSSRVAAKEYQKMARIILAATGNSPEFSEFASAWFKGAIFSAISTQTTGILAGKSALTVQLMTESGAALSALKDRAGVGGVLKDLGNVWGNWLDSFRDLIFEAYQSAQDGSTFAEQLNVEQERAGREKNQGVDARVHVDALTKVRDLLANRLPRDLEAFKKEKNLKNALKLSKQILRLATLMRGTFRALGAVDSAVSKAYTRTQTNILAFRENRQLLAKGEGGLSEQELAELVDAAHKEADAYTQSLMDQGVLRDGDTKGDKRRAANLARVVYRDRVQQQVFGALVRAGVRPEIPGETLKDIQAKIGTGAFDKTSIAELGAFITRLGTSAQKIPIIGGLTGGVLLALRTPSVVADFLAWGMPGINVKRTYDLIKLRRTDPERAEELFPSISADWVARRRIAMALGSYPLTVLLTALLADSADEEDENKTFWFTGSFPDDPAERERWAANKWQENMMILGPLRLRIDKGVSQELFGAMLMAKAIIDANNREPEEVTLAESYASSAKAAGLALTPSLDQVFELGARVKRRSTSTVDAGIGFVEEVGFRAVPFSGLLKTVKRATPGKVDERNSFASLLVNNPFYVFPDGEGVLHMRNVLGERLDQSVGVGDTLRRLGVPVFWTVEEKGRDPINREILQDFADKSYRGGKLSLPALQKRFEEAGVEFNSTNIEAYFKTYQQTFKNNYLPGKQDLRGLSEEDYKTRMRVLWTRSRKAADASFNLQPAPR